MKIQVSQSESFASNNFFRDVFEYFTTLFGDEPIEWGAEGNILAVTNVELNSLNQIAWQDVNLIAAETCQQIYDLAYKLDYTKAYIFVTESWADIEFLKTKFYGLPLIAHYAVFNEVFNYGSELFAAKSHITALPQMTEPPEYKFFSLIGRKSNLRTRFIYELIKQDLSDCLVRYNSDQVGNSDAPAELDQLNYKSGFYGDSHHYGMSTPSKLIQASLYNNFKAEVQFETDASGGQGWDLVEYHVTEKTLKPLIMGKPCIMFGPVGYHTWLDQFGIDLGLGNFDTDYDLVESDVERMCAVVDYIKQIDFTKVQPNQELHDKNIIGLHKLSNLSKANTLDLYRRIRAL